MYLTIMHPEILPLLKDFGVGIWAARFGEKYFLVVKASKELILTAKANKGFNFYLASIEVDSKQTFVLMTAFFDNNDEPLVITTPLLKNDGATNNFLELLRDDVFDVCFFDEHNRELLSYKASGHLKSNQTKSGKIESWITFAFGLSGAILYFIGHIAIDTRAANWHIGGGIFQSSSDECIYYGIYSILQLSTEVRNFFIKNPWNLSFLTPFALAVVFIYKHRKPTIHKYPVQNSTIAKKPKNFMGFFNKFWIAYSIIFAIIFGSTALTSIGLLIVYPIGKLGGDSLYEHDKKKIKDSNTCVSLQRDGIKLAFGVLIQSSTSHAFIFNLPSEKLQLFELSNIDIEYQIPCKNKD